MEIRTIHVSGQDLKAAASNQNEDPDRPTIVYLGGLLADQLSNHSESRAWSLQRSATEKKLNFIRFNYTAHGNSTETRSSGDFPDITITRMIDDALGLLEAYNIKKVAFVGSSIGAGLLPFLTPKCEAKDIDVVGFFTVSGLHPSALAVFIESQLDDNQRISLKKGSTVKIESPTLPMPVQVSPMQLEDVKKYDYSRVAMTNVARPTVGIAGSQDPVSTFEANTALLNVLCSNSALPIVFDSPHDIPDEFMIPEFLTWLAQIDTR